MIRLVFSEDIFTNRLEDIVSVGFCDNFTDEDIWEYTMDMNTMYFDFGNFMIRLEVIENFSRLRISRENKIRYDYRIDEDANYAFARLHNIIFRLGELDNLYIEKIVLYNLREKDDGFISCDAMKVCFLSGQVLFFDPANYWGMSVGDEALAGIWEEQNPSYTVTVVERENI